MSHALQRGTIDEGTLSEASTNNNNMEREFVFKVVVMGSYNVGKTTFVKRLLHTRLPARRDGGGRGSDLHEDDTTDDGDIGSDPDDIPVAPTVGTDFYSRVVRHVTPGTNVRLQIWDTAGLAKYTAVNETTYKNSSLVICLFDVSDRTSLAEVTERHLAQAAEFIPDLEQDGIFVVANKLDLVNPGEEAARAQSQRRAASPAAAFCAAGDEDDETTDLTSSLAGGGGPKAVLPGDLVTVKDVQEEILDLFAEVHYAEVSAKKRTGMSEVLQRICLALLRNEGELSEQEELTLCGGHGDDATFGIHRDSRLSRGTLSGDLPVPLAAPLVSDSRQANRGPVKKPANGTQPPPSATAKPTSPASLHDTEGPPSVAATATRRSSDMNPAPPPPAAAAAAVAASVATQESAGGGSWKEMGFSFDMGPSLLNNTAVFSPSSLPPTPAEQSGTSVGDRGPLHADPNAATAPPSEGKGRGANASWRNGTAAAAKPANESREERLAREKAEMAGLLGRRQGGGTAADGGGGGGATAAAAASTSRTSPANDDAAARPDRFRKADLDAAEEGEQQKGGGDGPRGGRKFHSLLDDVQRENDRQRLGEDGPGAEGSGAAAEEDDDDGAGLHEAIHNRFAEIDKNAELDRHAMREAAKKDKKYGTNKVGELKEKKAKEGPSVADMYKKQKAKEKCKCSMM